MCKHAGQARSSLCIMLYLFLYLGSESQAFGQLTWETRSRELTPTPEDLAVTAEFPFANRTDRVIKILEVTSSCDCTTAKLDKRDYAPGEMGKIIATFTIGQRQGRQDKTIVLKTDDSTESTVLLRMKIDIPSVIEISPRFVYWTTDEAPVAKIVTVSVVAVKAVEVTSATSVGHFVVAELKEVQPGRQYQVVITPKETGEAFTDPIEIRAAGLPTGRNTFRAYAAVRNGASPNPQNSAAKPAVTNGG